MYHYVNTLAYEEQQQVLSTQFEGVYAFKLVVHLLICERSQEMMFMFSGPTWVKKSCSLLARNVISAEVLPVPCGTIIAL